MLVNTSYKFTLLESINHNLTKVRFFYTDNIDMNLKILFVYIVDFSF